MITTLKKYEDNYIENQLEIDYLKKGFYYGRKIIILESNWDTENVFNNISIYPFLSNISNIMGYRHPVEIGYRHFDSLRGLKFYAEYPEGKLWNDPNCFGCQVYYISVHGGPTSILPTMDIIRKEGMMDSLKGFDNYPCILFISGCGVFAGEEGQKFGLDLVGSTGARAVFGYSSPKVSFVDSVLIDLLFLTRFFEIQDGDPFEQLSDVFDSVVNDFKPAKEMKFSVFLR